jgi:transposase
MERRKFTREFKLEAVRLIKDRGVSYVQASQDLGVHTSQLRDWVKKLADDPQHAFPGQGQMKPEQLEIARLKREVTKLKAERDILKKAAVDSTDERNMMDIMFSPEDSQWRKWAGLVCRRSRSKSYGHGGRQASR